MTAKEFSLAATILLLFPMLYFGIASLTFFLAKLQDPVVTRLLRGLFSTAFGAIAALATLSALAFLLAARPEVTVALGLLALLAVLARRWFLRRMDQAIRARDSGQAAAVQALRRLHVGGILYNATQLVALIGSIPRLFDGA